MKYTRNTRLKSLITHILCRDHGRTGPVAVFLTNCTKSRTGANNLSSAAWWADAVCWTSCGLLSFCLFSRSPCPPSPDWPCLLKKPMCVSCTCCLSLCAFAAGGRCLLELRHTHTHAHTLCAGLRSVCPGGQEGGHSRMTTTACVTRETACCSPRHLQRAPPTHFHKSSHAVVSLRRCGSALHHLSRFVEAQAADGRYENAHANTHTHREKAGLQLRQYFSVYF